MYSLVPSVFTSVANINYVHPMPVGWCPLVTWPVSYEDDGRGVTPY